MGFVIDLSTLIDCSHIPGKATPGPPTSRVRVGGQPVVTIDVPYVIGGCPLSTPCASGKWLAGAGHVRAGGLAVAIDDGISTCAPTNNPLVPRGVQQRVTAT